MLAGWSADTTGSFSTALQINLVALAASAVLLLALRSEAEIASPAGPE